MTCSDLTRPAVVTSGNSVIRKPPLRGAQAAQKYHDFKIQEYKEMGEGGGSTEKYFHFGFSVKYHDGNLSNQAQHISIGNLYLTGGVS